MDQPAKDPDRFTTRFFLVYVLILLGVIGLCMWFYNGMSEALSRGPFEVPVRTWRDDNRNGVWDEGEPPLAYVTVHLEDVVDGEPNSQWVTDESGGVLFGGLLWPERSDIYKVYAEAPPGYEVIGPERIRVDFDEIEQTPVALGLALLPGQPTPTPRPAIALDCHLIDESSSENDHASVMAIQPGQEGSVVLTLANPAGLCRYAADGAFVESLPAVPIVPSEYSAVFPRIRVGPDGRIWAWGSHVADGLAVFDGTAWRSVAPYNRPGEYRAYDLAIALDGAVWLGTDLGALRLDDATGEWTRHASLQSISAVAPAADGTIWLLQCNPPGRCNQALTQRTPGGPRLYEESKVPPLGIHHGNVWGASYDGSSIWVINGRGLARWDIAAAMWTEYTPATTNYALPPDSITAYDQAPDGTLWLARYENGLIRARPRSGEWYFANSPLIDGQYIDDVVVAGDGSVWVSLRYEYAVYRCE